MHLSEVPRLRPIHAKGATAPSDGVLRRLSLENPLHCNLITRSDARLARSFQFYCIKTAPELSGYYDRHFWTCLAPKLAASYPAVKHALIALGAYHESLEARERLDEGRHSACSGLGKQQGVIALTCLRQDYSQMKLAAILCCYILITQFSSILGEMTYFQTQKAQFQIIDGYHYDEQRSNGTENFIAAYLEPLVERQRSSAGRAIDPIFCLKSTPLIYFCDDVPSLPAHFQSLWQARQTLEAGLSAAAYEVKARQHQVNNPVRPSRAAFDRWLEALDKTAGPHTRARSDADGCSYQMLRTSSKIAFMMLDTMNSDDEMIFDDYEDDYKEFAEALSNLLSVNKSQLKTNVCFGIDSGLLCLTGWIAQRFCRDPTTRSRLINLLATAQRTEGVEGGRSWSHLCQVVQTHEEANTRLENLPFRKASDIPLRNRVRIVKVEFFYSTKTQRMTVLHWPYDENDESNVRHLWLSYLGKEIVKSRVMTPDGLHEKPNLVHGRGFTSFLVGREYCTFKAKQFFFPIPRV